MSENKQPDHIDDSKPPIFKSWTGWYILVLGNLMLMILIFYLFTIAYK